MTYKYTLNNGAVCCSTENGFCDLQAKELYDIIKTFEWKRFASDELASLQPLRKPATLTFEVTIDANIIIFKAFWQGKELSECESKTAKSLGYFIRDERLFFLSEDGLNELYSLNNGPSIQTSISAIRTLKLSSRLISAPDNIVSLIRESEAALPRETELFIRALYPYQVKGVEWLCFCISYGLGTILADDMGLGKTAQIIAAICDLISKDPMCNILLVVPNPLLENWRREFSYFAPSVEPFLHYGSGRTGLSIDLQRYNVVITSYNTLTSDISMLTEIQFHLAVFDEASLVKNPKSSRTVASNLVRAKVKFAVTGTPVENHLSDAWSLSNLVVPGYLGTYKEFDRLYVGKNITETLSLNLSELEVSLRQILLRRMKSEVLKEIPIKQDIHLPITMQENERESYEKLISTLRDDLASDYRNILAIITKLQQFTCHPSLLTGDVNSPISQLCASSGKFELMVNYLDKIFDSGEKVLVFATFHKMIDILANLAESRYGLKSLCIDGRTPNDLRQEHIDEFSASIGFNMLILHPRTAGMGLNITAATHVIHYSRQWNPALEMQATARAWRNGQKKPVTVYYFYYCNSIEEIIDSRLRQKQELSDSVVTTVDEKESDKQLLLNYLERGGL